MAATRLLMRRLRDILRLKYEAGLPHRAIAQACAVGLGTVSAYLAARHGGRADAGRCPTTWMTRRWRRACLRARPTRPAATGRCPTWRAAAPGTEDGPGVTLQLALDRVSRGAPDRATPTATSASAIAAGRAC